MKLIRCHIENFGKLQNFNYEFKDGLNTIKKENGFGKTTFANFIKVMFYGIDTSKLGKLERQQYTPWQGGKFGGNIEFELNNKSYRIERFFEKKASDDTFKLYDLKTNLESTDYTENIGEEIFKINKESYERSTYIPQGQIQVEMNDSINAKLGNVVEGENDINTSEEAIKRIEENMKLYIKRGNKGLINEKFQTLNEIKRKIEEIKIDEENLEIRKKKYRETVNLIKEKEDLRNQKLQEETKKAKLETYNEIIKKLEESENKKKKLQKFFKSGIPTDEELDILSKKCIEIEKYKGEVENFYLPNEEKNTLEQLNKMFRFKKTTIEEIDDKISQYKEKTDIENRMQQISLQQTNLQQEVNELEDKKKKNKNISISLMIISFILIFCGIVLIIIKKYIGISFLTIGVLSFILSIIKRKKQKDLSEKQKRQKDKLENLIETQGNLSLRRKNIDANVINFINNYMDDYNNEIIALTEIKTQFTRYTDLNINKNKRQLKFIDITEKIDSLEEYIKKYLYKYFPELDKDFPSLVQDLKLQKTELNRVMQELENSKKSKLEYENKNNIEYLKSIKDDEMHTKDIELEIDKLNDEKNQNKNEIEYLENQIDEIEDLEAEKENIEEEINTMQEKYDILEKTKIYMEQAKENFSSHYLKKMVEEFNKYLKLLDNKELNTNVDINLGVQIDSNGSKREIKYFSSGYKDLIYICMRFSLIKVLFEKELPFVVLDDPFVNLDDEKMKKAIELLKKLSIEYQIIYFVCNESRS